MSSIVTADQVRQARRQLISEIAGDRHPACIAESVSIFVAYFAGQNKEHDPPDDGLLTLSGADECDDECREVIETCLKSHGDRELAMAGISGTLLRQMIEILWRTLGDDALEAFLRAILELLS